ncbi:MAG: DUF465 domain-containing protein [Acidimicrobiales bacterium]|nr:DUF465 domain-containing protein [Hyphomonadaceae bacterium]RZV42274.1 MAG: DUF465 domain-containing protein [Acidimicrobiales bacterium]
MDDDILDQQVLQQELKQLREAHRQLDNEIQALRETGAVDMLKVGRMKKIKLKLKDKIAAIEDSLTPDIIA